MKPSELQDILSKPSMKALNQHLLTPCETNYLVHPSDPPIKPAKRIRQSQKPVLNKLEREWFDHLKIRWVGPFRAQAKRYQYGNGAWYRPDVTCSHHYHLDSGYTETAWEVKGPKQMKGIARGMVVLKAAAHCWPEVRFILVWKENGEWKEQVVLP